MWLSFIICLYFLPAIIAFGFRKEFAGGIFLVNLIGGVTGLGWIIAMFWAIVATQEEWHKNHMKLVCKKCKQHYTIPDTTWFGREMICCQCDNFIRVPNPLFVWEWIRSFGLLTVIFLWMFVSVFYHFLCAIGISPVPQ